MRKARAIGQKPAWACGLNTKASTPARPGQLPVGRFLLIVRSRSLPDDDWCESRLALAMESASTTSRWPQLSQELKRELHDLIRDRLFDLTEYADDILPVRFFFFLHQYPLFRL